MKNLIEKVRLSAYNTCLWLMVGWYIAFFAFLVYAGWNYILVPITGIIPEMSTVQACIISVIGVVVIVDVCENTDVSKQSLQENQTILQEKEYDGEDTIYPDPNYSKQQGKAKKKKKKKKKR